MTSTRLGVNKVQEESLLRALSEVLSEETFLIVPQLAIRVGTLLLLYFFKPLTNLIPDAHIG